MQERRNAKDAGSRAASSCIPAFQPSCIAAHWLRPRARRRDSKSAARGSRSAAARHRGPRRRAAAVTASAAHAGTACTGAGSSRTAASAADRASAARAAETVRRECESARDATNAAANASDCAHRSGCGIGTRHSRDARASEHRSAAHRYATTQCRSARSVRNRVALHRTSAGCDPREESRVRAHISRQSRDARSSTGRSVTAGICQHLASDLKESHNMWCLHA
jgi:hypothetical protein